MKFRDLAELAWRNLREAVLRNSLTTLGIAVGVASLVAMLSLGVGLQELASKRLSRSGLFDAIIVAPRSNFRGFARQGRANFTPGEPPRQLDEEARQAIERLPDVVEAYPDIRFPTEIRYRGSPYPAVVAGMPQSVQTGGAFDGMKGAFFSGPEADEAILQIEFARQLSQQTDALIGREIVLRYAERQALPAAPRAGAGRAGGTALPRSAARAARSDHRPRAGSSTRPSDSKARPLRTPSCSSDCIRRHPALPPPGWPSCTRGREAR